MTAPGWFQNAIQTPYEDCFVTVDGTKTHYLLWRGDPPEAGHKNPGLVFVHGNGAHAHWWAFIAPFFLSHYDVIALDLAGAGDSEHRAAYNSTHFAAQVAQVADDAGFGNDTVVVGHSFGGFVTLRTGLLYCEQLAGIVLVDSAVRPPDFKWERDPRRSPIKQKRVYETFEAAFERFRLMPPQDCENTYLLDYIAHHSLIEVDGGWTWKFDDGLFSKFSFEDGLHEDLARLACRVGVIYGENSDLFTQELTDYMFGILDQSVPFTGIPEARHHLFLDQPLAFVSSLRTLLAEWRHSKPHRNI